jgi:poly(A) polymerase
MKEVSERTKFRFFRDLGELAVPMLLVSLADRYTYLTAEERGKKTDLHERSTKELLRWHYQKKSEQPEKKHKLIDGHILIDRLGLEPGPQMGEILRDLEEEIALGHIASTDEALDTVKRWLADPRTRIPRGEAGA